MILKETRLGLTFVRYILYATSILTVQVALATTAQVVNPHTTISSKEFSYQVAPVPSFVVGPQIKPVPATGNGHGDSILLLYDHQLSLLDKEPQHYVRLEVEPLSASGLQNVSQITILFNPEYQKLLLHHIYVWRDAKLIDMTKRVKLDLIRRETNLEESLYTGNVTAVGVLPDIRVNDVIDVAYTVVGQNPIFDNRFAEVYSMTQDRPLAHFSFLLSSREDRKIEVKPPLGTEVQKTLVNGTVIYSIEKDNVKPVVIEDRMPSWYEPLKLIQVSEYRDWTDVENWANGLFKTSGPVGPELQKQLQQWRSNGLSREGLVSAALQWVQSRVRYFGIEMGVNSHLPTQPDVTFQRRFGDCKDKSLLLASMLKAMNIDAEPALASIRYRRNVKSMMPSPALFDHVIVRVRLDGKTYWLDPTLPTQYGKLDSLGMLDYGEVLPLGAEEGNLESASLPSGDFNLEEVKNRFVWEGPTKPVTLVTQYTVNRSLADSIRYAHDKQTPEEFKKSFQDSTVSIFPSAHLAGDPVYTDDKENNQVTVSFTYSIDDFFRYSPGHLSTDVLAVEALGWAVLPNTAQRVSPMALPSHNRLIQTTEIDFPSVSSFKDDRENNQFENEFWGMSIDRELHPDRVKFIWSLKAKRESVPAARMAEYITSTRELRAKMGLSLNLPISDLTNVEKNRAAISVQKILNEYGKSSSKRVSAQIREIFDLAQVTKDIKSGKLNNKQLAQAYKIRSIAYDDQGYSEKALEDIRAAEKLVPDTYEYVEAEADTLLGNGQFEAARQVYEKAIKLADANGLDNSHALRSYGVTLHYLGRDMDAKNALDQAIQKSSSSHAMYSAIWRYIVAAKDPDSATKLQSVMDDISDKTWPYPVGEAMLGRITPEQLIQKAESDDKGIQADQYTEAYFYIGEKYLLENRKSDANESFQNCLDQNVPLYGEYNYSLHELGKKRGPITESFWSRLKGALP